MGRSLILAVALLTCVTACSGGKPAAAPSTSAPSPTSAKPTTSAPTTTAAPAFTPLVSPAKVTAACPFLGAAEIPQLIGDGSLPSGKPEEGKVDDLSNGSKGYNCTYGWGWLWIATFRSGALPLSKVFEIEFESCTQPAIAIPAIGEGAKYCFGKDGKVQVIAGKHTHGQLRVAEVSLTKTRSDVYPSIAKLVVDRL